MKVSKKIEPRTLGEIIKLNPPKEESIELNYPNEDEEEELDTTFEEE